MQNYCFLDERQFFGRKLSKIAENCDHNIDHCISRDLKKGIRLLKFAKLKLAQCAKKLSAFGSIAHVHMTPTDYLSLFLFLLMK
jgi:hypothetical protein